MKPFLLFLATLLTGEIFACDDELVIRMIGERFLQTVKRKMYPDKLDILTRPEIKDHRRYVKGMIKAEHRPWFVGGKISSAFKALHVDGKIHQELIPDANIRKYAQEVWNGFGDKKKFSDFLIELYVQMGLRIEGYAQSLIESGEFQRLPSEYAPAAIFQIAKELGFKKELILRDLMTTEEMRTSVLNPDVLIIGAERDRIFEVHGGYSHYLQMMYTRSLLNESYGPNAYVEFMNYMTTEPGYKFWLLAYDYGPRWYLNPRHPRFWTETNIVFDLGLY